MIKHKSYGQLRYCGFNNIICHNSSRVTPLLVFESADLQVTLSHLFIKLRLVVGNHPFNLSMDAMLVSRGRKIMILPRRQHLTCLHATNASPSVSHRRDRFHPRQGLGWETLGVPTAIWPLFSQCTSASSFHHRKQIFNLFALQRRL